MASDHKLSGFKRHEFILEVSVGQKSGRSGASLLGASQGETPGIGKAAFLPGGLGEESTSTLVRL